MLDLASAIRRDWVSRCVVASVPWAEGLESVFVGCASVQEVVGPLGDFGVGGVLADLDDGGLDVEVRGSQIDAWAQDDPVGSGSSVGHANTAGVDYEAAVGEADERHVGVAADHGADVGSESAEDFFPAVEAGVDQDDFFIVTGGGMAEQDLPEAAHGQGERSRQRAEKVEVVLAELFGSPGGDRIGD